MSTAPGGDVPSEESSDLQAFFDGMPSAQFVLDGSRTIRRANFAAQRIFAPAGSRLEGHPFLDLIDAGTRSTVDGAIFGLASAGPPSVRIPSAVRVVDGSAVRVELLIVRLQLGSGAGFGVVIRDLGAAGQEGMLDRLRETKTGTYTLAELLMANRLRELV